MAGHPADRRAPANIGMRPMRQTGVQDWSGPYACVILNNDVALPRVLRREDAMVADDAVVAMWA